MPVAPKKQPQRVTLEHRQLIEARALFERLARTGQLRVSCRIDADHCIPGMDEGTWIFGTMMVTGGNVYVEYTGDSPLPKGYKKQPSKTSRDSQEQEYAVWSEGWEATGGSGTAQLEGRVRANSFGDACVRLLHDRKDFDPTKLTLWGCRLFPTEAEARESFG